ncbi:MAG: D-sedoheptulose 7-phosphate isomerase [Pseudomonadales bacterium]|uniref:Phosphoheptose isomerase n=1 Tax=Oleiphilus messinensis TaxID=141451 RepID=A0A1Y0I2Z6_9GAMM|nr:D-sedoheptulose 7-phosphate isomerase [Oleiphilus messinensis]ARU54842.1 phosphoheptose isomerase [Oleiphilus messinensis]MCG8612608.1 D-sedoheptulose 7-phosphate isomerase [Pseudomonadales bacterium]
MTVKYPHTSLIAEHINRSVEAKTKLLNDASFLAALNTVAETCTDALLNGKKIVLAGNGGSAADAQHIAAELVGRYKKERRGLPAIAITTDTSALTAIGNDYGYEQVFARQVEALCQKGDVFIGITTSGNSKNILAAIHSARDIQCTTIGMTGCGGNIVDQADQTLSVPASETATIQECHIMIGHILCALIEENETLSQRPDQK